MNSVKKRDIWVDNVKVIACVLVVLGHFFPSLIEAGIIQDGFLHQWFKASIYYFHVPLFFICSGYLYQKYSTANNMQNWKINIFKKLIALGIPYFVFSFLTWGLKKVNGASVNSKAGSLLDTLFFHPSSPYWYLYTLFFIFVITITVTKFWQISLLLVVSLVLKVIYYLGWLKTGVYIISSIKANWVWFVLGMAMAYGWIKQLNVISGAFLVMLFVIGSFLTQIEIIRFKGVEFLLGLLACLGIISIIQSEYSTCIQNKYWRFCARYTMPVFLMHTMFAAALRSILVRMGIKYICVHIIFGLIISFVGPIMAMVILEKLRPLDFIIYPSRYLKIYSEECSKKEQLQEN